jgi:hypothetical protein
MEDDIYLWRISHVVQPLASSSKSVESSECLYEDSMHRCIARQFVGCGLIVVTSVAPSAASLLWLPVFCASWDLVAVHQ